MADTNDMYDALYLTKDELIAFFVILVLILVSGVIGNILSIVTWSKGKRCSKAGSSAYFQLLAASDLCVLLLNVTVEVIDECKFHQNFRTYNNNWLMNKIDFFCKFTPFSWHFCSQVSAWITVALTIDRTLNISFPMQFYRTNASKRAYIVSGVIFLASFAINVPTAVLHTRVTKSFKYYDQNGTATNYTYTRRLCKPRDSPIIEYISMVYITFAIPFLILTFCNITILVKLCKNRHLASSNNTRRQRSIKNVTQLVFGVSVLQCVSGLPMAYVHTRYSEFKWLKLEFIDKNGYFFFLLATVCYYLISSLNWVLYSLIGKDFREDMKDLLKKCTKQTVNECNSNQDWKSLHSGTSSRIKPTLHLTTEQGGKTKTSPH